MQNCIPYKDCIGNAIYLHQEKIIYWSQRRIYSYVRGGYLIDTKKSSDIMIALSILWHLMSTFEYKFLLQVVSYKLEVHKDEKNI